MDDRITELLARLKALEHVISPGEKRGESHATLRGELMAILDLAAGRPRSLKQKL